MIGALDGPVTQPTTHAPSQAELDAADTATNSWPMYNKGYRAERYSSLDLINSGNAAQLRPVCMFQLGEIGTFSTGPVEYDGLLYVTSHLSTYAIDATTCKKVWSNTHAPRGPEMNATNKGVAIAGGRVFRGSQDGFLYALDAKTGAVLWKRQVADWSLGEGIGAAPVVWNDIVYVGKDGGDWGIQGSMMAFHVEDGSLAWSFDLIPSADQPGGGGWPNDAARSHGGGGVWVSFALDRDTGVLFVPVGNPGPDFNASGRAGANLFTISTVALDAKTGKLKWAYQLRQNDDHDWDATAVSLFDSDGRKLLATAGKEGIPPCRRPRHRSGGVQASGDDDAQPRRAANARGRPRLSGRGRPMERSCARPRRRSPLCERDRLVHAVQAWRCPEVERDGPVYRASQRFRNQRSGKPVVGLDQCDRSKDETVRLARAPADANVRRDLRHRGTRALHRRSQWRVPRPRRG